MPKYGRMGEWLTRGLTTATQSSTPAAGYHANKALDEEYNSGSRTYAKTATEPYAWWKVDLIVECIVTQVSIVRSNSGNFEGAEIRVGNNYDTFTANPLFAIFPSGINTGDPTIIDGDSALLGRVVSLQFQQGGAALQMLLVDMHVFGYRTKDTSECYFDSLGRDYRGTVNQTIDAMECQSWTAQDPHEHDRTPENYPDTGLGEHNYCRNPDDGPNGPWCYTTDPGTRWAFCPVYECSSSCVAFHTPNYGSVRVQNHNFHYPWAPIPDDVSRLTFTLKTNRDAYIALSPSDTTEDDSDIMPKINLGGWTNTQSGHLCDSTDDWHDLTSTPSIFSSIEDRTFFIAFSNSTIEFGNVGREPTLIFQSVCDIDVKYIGVASGHGSTADWSFCGYDTLTNCQGPVPIGWKVRNRVHTDGNGYIMVAPEKPVLCDGIVTEWHYWGSRSEPFIAIIWRRIFGVVNEYEVVGTNEIPAGDFGKEVIYSVPIEHRIQVLKGDVIGFGFVQSLLVFDVAGVDGVKIRWFGGGDPFGLRQGQRITFDGSGVRGYSLKAVVDILHSTKVLVPKGLWPFNTKYELSDLTGHKSHGTSTNAIYQSGTISGILDGYMTLAGAGGSCVEAPVVLDMYVSEFTLLLYIERIIEVGGAPILWFDTYPDSSFLSMTDTQRIGFKVVTEAGTLQMFSGRFMPKERFTFIAVTYRATDGINSGTLSIWSDGHLQGIFP
ncbi:uncharacterized protein [Amphiura filiformis]|uniref:uncharacterized protein n=1 Tax=Amphiura filiformis TaxID=82378 RepID=UPI003B222864